MQTLRDLRTFLALIWHDWLALMSGIFSIVLAGLAGTFPSLPPWLFWPAAMLAVFVAAFRVWQRQHRGGPFDLARRKKAQEEVAKLSASEKEVLRQLLVRGQMAEGPIHAHLAGLGLDPVHLPRLESAGLLARDFVGYWTINPAFAPMLGELLSHTPQVP